MATKDSGGKASDTPSIYGTPSFDSTTGTTAYVLINLTSAYQGKGGNSTYTVTSSSGQSASATNLTQYSNQVAVPGLTAGASVTFTAVATSPSGVVSEVSNTSPAITPGAKPATPTIGVSAAGNTAATVNWTKGSNGTAAAANVTFRVQSSPASTTTEQTITNASSISFTGLTNGVAYQFRVRAESVYGNSDFSEYSTAVTPVAPPYFPPFFPPYFPPYFPPRFK